MRSYLQPVYVAVSFRKSNAEPSAKRLSRADFFYLKRHTKYQTSQVIERISEGRYKQMKMQEDAATYDAAIMKKYGVGANYRSDRYFMEQVRPTRF